MASDNGEHKMVFDVRGRRKNVIRVVYALLAVLMGLSLLLFIGPGVGGIFGTSGTSEEAAEKFEDQAAAIELRLKKNPDDPNLLLALTRQRVYAGNALSAIDPTTGVAALTPEARNEIEQASASWSKYLEATDDPSPSGAQVMAPALFGLAETSTTYPEAEANLAAAAEAQQILADKRPSLGTLSTAAIFQYFAGNFALADQNAKKARAAAGSKFERENLENKLEETKKSAKNFQKEAKQAAKASKGKGKESLENPLGGLGGGGLAP